MPSTLFSLFGDCISITFFNFHFLLKNSLLESTVYTKLTWGKIVIFDILWHNAISPLGRRAGNDF